jgi:hypothetical protein
MVTQPLQGVLASGSLIKSEVSLGYDVPHDHAMEILCEAADRSPTKHAMRSGSPD